MPKLVSQRIKQQHIKNLDRIEASWTKRPGVWQSGLGFLGIAVAIGIAIHADKGSNQQVLIKHPLPPIVTTTPGTVNANDLWRSYVVDRDAAVELPASFSKISVRYLIGTGTLTLSPSDRHLLATHKEVRDQLKDAIFAVYDPTAPAEYSGVVVTVSVHLESQPAANHINDALHQGVDANAGVGPLPAWLPTNETEFSGISPLTADLGEYVNLSAGPSYKFVSNYTLSSSQGDNQHVKTTDFVMLHGRSLYDVSVYLYDAQITANPGFPTDVITHWSWQRQPMRH